MNNIFNKIFDVILLIISALLILCMLASYILLYKMFWKAVGSYKQYRYGGYLANASEIKIMNIYLVSSYILYTIGLFNGNIVSFFLCGTGFPVLIVITMLHIFRKTK